ncbi:MAG: hypothetical protein AB7R89_12830 [Dehalococcoidia bacterium]
MTTKMGVPVDRTIAYSWRRDVRCFRCDSVAAGLLVDYESGGRGLTLTLLDFLVRKTSYLSEPAAEGIAEDEEIELLRWLPPTFHGFFCRECGAAYCRRCWDIGAPLYTEGEYLGTAGICPAGHQALVDQS